MGLRGKVCLVTGGTSGIGRAAVLGLAREGAELVLLARNEERAEALVGELSAAVPGVRVDVLRCDLARLEDIRRAAADFLAMDRPLHVLLNNAGVFCLRREQTADGFERMFGVNHLGYFLVTNLLLDRLRESAPSRVVNVASDAHRFVRGSFPFDDPQSERRYFAMRAYGISKLGNLLFTRELARRLQHTNVTANAVHPGMVATSLGRQNGWLGGLGLALVRPFARTPERGADTAVWLCASPEVEGRTGEYFHDREPLSPGAAARSDADAERLWALSEKLVGRSD